MLLNFLFFSLVFCLANSQEEPDRQILIDFYNGLTSKDLSWDTQGNLCLQDGVRCENSRVVELLLAGFGLAGTIPTQLGGLTSLRVLNLQVNELTGSIPSEFGNLNSLTIMRLDSNTLTETIPKELGKLQSLLNLNLQFNQISGPIPSELGNMASLNFMRLSFNELNGTIPTEIGKLNNLQLLILAYNKLTGAIPTEVGNLKNVTSMFLFENGLNGTIPTEISLMESMSRLALDSNQLTGVIPTELSKLQKITWLHLHSNNLHGTIPTQLGQMTSLLQLYLGSNNLNGIIPTELTKLQLLTNLELYSCDLSGTIPTQLGELKSLTSLSLFGNKLDGTIPSQLANLKLASLSLLSNKLTGKIPTELTSILSLDSISLDLNYFDCPVLDYSSIPSNDYSSLNSRCANCDAGKCRSEFTCVISGVSYTEDFCKCPMGFYSNQSAKFMSSCLDVNECSTNNGGCSPNAECINTFGSRGCQCKAGYTGDGIECSPLPCNPDSGFQLTQSGETAKLFNCPANQFGFRSRSCSFGIWSPTVHNCQPCIAGFVSNVGSSECVPGSRLTDMVSWRPIYQFFLDGNTMDSSLNNGNISTFNYQFVNFYNRFNQVNNRALRINSGSGVTINNVVSDGTFSVHMIINSITAKVSSILRILNSNNQVVLRVGIASNGRLNYYNSLGSLVGTSHVVIRTGYSYFVIFSYSGSMISTFVDTSQLNRYSIAVPDGIYSFNIANSFDGFLDEVHIYDSATWRRNFHIPSQRTKCLTSCSTGQVCYNTANEMCGSI